MERLQKVIASSGVASRRKAEELIVAGKVMVNGEVVCELGTKVSGNDEIIIDGKRLVLEEKEYYLLNKPRGVVSTTRDELDRDNIVDLIDTKARIYPVGRLDYDTTGLILLTNDGDLANLLTHPSNKVEKTYVAKLEGILSMEAFFKIKEGVKVDGEKVVPTRLKIKKKNAESKTTLVEITITVGMNHVVKKIFSSVGYEVMKLTRTKLAFLDLGKLQSGEYRELSLKEVKKLYSEK